MKEKQRTNFNNAIDFQLLYVHCQIYLDTSHDNYSLIFQSESTHTRVRKAHVKFFATALIMNRSVFLTLPSLILKDNLCLKVEVGGRRAFAFN